MTRTPAREDAAPRTGASLPASRATALRRGRGLVVRADRRGDARAERAIRGWHRAIGAIAAMRGRYDDLVAQRRGDHAGIEHRMRAT